MGANFGDTHGQAAAGKIVESLSRCCANTASGLSLNLSSPQLPALESVYRRHMPFQERREIDALSRHLLRQLEAAGDVPEVDELLQVVRPCDASQAAWKGDLLFAEEMEQSLQIIWQYAAPMLLDLVGRAIDEQGQANLIDLGGGNLWAATQLRKALPPDACSITIVDIHAPDEGQRKLLQSQQINYVCATMQDVDMAELGRRPNCVFASRAIEYDLTPQRTLSTLEKVLERGARGLFVHNSPDGIDHYKIGELHGLMEGYTLLYRGLLMLMRDEASKMEVECVVHQRAESLSEETMSRIVGRMVTELLAYERFAERPEAEAKFRMIENFERRLEAYGGFAKRIFQRWQGLLDGYFCHASTEEALNRLYLDVGFVPRRSELVHLGPRKVHSYYVHSVEFLGKERCSRIPLDNVVPHKEIYA